MIIEQGVSLESEITNILWLNSNLNEESLNMLFNFDIEMSTIKEVTISNGIFNDSTLGELVQVTIVVSMNNISLLSDSETLLGQDLSFDYLLNVSNK